MFRFGERMKDGKCMIIIFSHMFRKKGAGRKGREFSNKATREILSACPEFSFKSSLLWFAPRILAITCAARFMDSKRQLW